jgi:hypothetical protein
MMKTALFLLNVSVAAASVAACEIRVGPDEGRNPRDVDIDTPLGDLTVRSDTQPSDVGVAVYPGAQLLEDVDDPSRANVSIASPFVDLEVSAMKFASADAPDAIAEFYRRELSRYGPVTVCRGDLDFEDESSPRCQSRRRNREQLQIGVGTKGNFRLASVKSRGVGSEFAVVYVRTANDL